MEKKNVIERIQALFSTEELFQDVELTEGNAKVTTAVEGELSVGDSFVLVNAEGEDMETPDGDYVTAEGLTISVAEGKITELKDKVEDEEEAVEEVAEEEVAEPAAEEFEAVSAYIELPVGVHTIGDKIYTVIEVTTGEGEDAYTSRVIDSIVPVEEEEEVVVPVEEEAASQDMSAENDALEALAEGMEALKAELNALSLRVNDFAAAPADTHTETKVSFAANTREEKIKFFSQK